VTFSEDSQDAPLPQRLQGGLGGGQPGSAASRMLLQVLL
jgi:hypothetical protein